MAGMETVAGFLAARAWRRARRAGGRARAHVDPAVDAALERLHEAVALKLGINPALSQLGVEAEASADSDRVQVGASTIDWAAAVLEGAVAADLGFAAHLWKLIADIYAAENASGDRTVITAITASGQRAIALNGGNPGTVSSGDSATIKQNFIKTYFMPFINIITTHAPLAAAVATASLVFTVALAHAVSKDQQPSTDLRQGLASNKPIEGFSSAGKPQPNPSPKKFKTTSPSTAKANPGPISSSTGAPPTIPHDSATPNVKNSSGSPHSTTPFPAHIPDLSGAYKLDYTPEDFGNKGKVIFYWTTLRRVTDPQCTAYKYDPCYRGQWYSDPEQTQPNGGQTWITIKRPSNDGAFILTGEDNNHSLNSPYTDQVRQLYLGTLKAANPLTFGGVMQQEQFHADFVLTRLS